MTSLERPQTTLHTLVMHAEVAPVAPFPVLLVKFDSRVQHVPTVCSTRGRRTRAAKTSRFSSRAVTSASRDFGVSSLPLSRTSAVTSPLLLTRRNLRLRREVTLWNSSVVDLLLQAPAQDVTATFRPRPTTATVIHFVSAAVDFRRSRSATNPAGLASASQSSALLSLPSQAADHRSPTATLPTSLQDSCSPVPKSRSVINPGVTASAVPLFSSLGRALCSGIGNSLSAVSYCLPTSQVEAQDAQVQYKTGSVTNPKCRNQGCVPCQLSCPCAPRYACAFCCSA